MVCKNNVTRIVNLCKLKNETTEYVPNLFDDEQNIGPNEKEFGDLKVVNDKSKEQKSDHSNVRFLQILNKDGAVIQEVKHIHFLSWPDFGTPDEASIKYTDELIKSLAQFIKE